MKTNQVFQNQPFSGAYSITVNVGGTNTGDRVYLPDTPVLQNKRITAIEVFWESITWDVQDPDGKIISGVPFDDLFLTLCDFKQMDFISKIPLNYFARGNKQININRYMFLPDSYFTVGAPIPEGTNVFMTFYWCHEGACEVKNEISPWIQGVEVPVYSSQQNRFYLPDNRVLVGKKIRNIYSGNDGNTPSGVPYVGRQFSFLTLVYQNDIILYRYPIDYLSQWNTPFRLRMNNLRADLPSSYIELSADMYQTIGDKAVYLNFEYEH